MYQKVNVPYRIQSTFEGYNYLIELLYYLKSFHGKKLLICFENCNWFEANLTAVLGAIFDEVVKQNNSINLTGFNDSLYSIFGRNGFLSYFGAGKVTDMNRTTISYTEFTHDKGTGFKDYIREKLLRKDDFPKLSFLAEKKINESIFELFENAHTHGDCEKIHTCGQYFPRKTPPRIDMTIVDMGQTIKANVNNYLSKFGKEPISGSKAIEWALVKGNTTKMGDNPGGLGLDVIFKFIKLNKGKIQIVSADGYWEFRRGATQSSLFKNEFPGTIANIEFNLDDRSYYQMKSEISLKGIF
jgi:hypothetical protein